jgi:hypothetical protein
MTEPIRKTFNIKVLVKRKDGGRILINTASVDRDRDRVIPAGARTDNYLKNPVVQWGHNYRDPWATVGKSNSLTISDDGIVADFDLRPAANDQDPQAVVLLLWNGDWVRTASIGFIPTAGKPNDAGGTDYSEWELLEWSIVPIPANQDALRLAVKGLEPNWGKARSRVPRQRSPACRQDGETVDECVSRKIPEILDENPGMDHDQAVAIAESMCATACSDKAADPPAPVPESVAWIRTLQVETELGKQKSFACFRSYSIDIPEDATTLELNEDGECEEVPHPEAGKTVAMKDCAFVPPVAFVDDEWGEDAVYSVSAKAMSDEDLVKADWWDVVELSAVQLALPIEKSWKGRPVPGPGIKYLTKRMNGRLQKMIRQRHKALEKALAKRGRVLSAKNEDSLRGAQADIDSAKGKIDGVLAQLDEQPPDEGKETGGNAANASAADASDTSSPKDSEVEQVLLDELKQLTTKVKEAIS